MMVMLKGANQCDTIFTSNGKFIFSKKLAFPELFTLICIKNKQSIDAIKENNERKMRSKEDGVTRELFLANGALTIISSFSNLKNAAILLTNHSEQDKYDAFRKRFDPLVSIARTIIDSSYKPNRTESEKKIFNMLYNKVLQIETDVAKRFATENTNNIVGAYVLYRYCRIDNCTELDSLYHLFNSSLYNSSYLKNIKEKIKALSLLKEGDLVPGFTATTYNNKTITLSTLNGKYAVLDFWGSWCTPCIKGIPKMKEYYKKYKSAIEFIGIACNENKNTTTFRDAIDKYELNWPQILNPFGRNNLAVRYNIEVYPTKILIDRNGKLIQVFKGETEDFYTKLDSLLTETN